MGERNVSSTRIPIFEGENEGKADFNSQNFAKLVEKKGNSNQMWALDFLA